MKKIPLLFIALIITAIANAQTTSPELISSAGNSFTNSTYQLDWSVGECVTETYNAGTYVITQGFHQNIYVITEVKNLAQDINISVYPNPTNNLLTVNLEASVVERSRNIRLSSVLTVTDINGKVLLQTKVTSDKEQLNFSNYANGIYFLSVSQLHSTTGKNQLIKSFKIIKN